MSHLTEEQIKEIAQQIVDHALECHQCLIANHLSEMCETGQEIKEQAYKKWKGEA